MRNKRLITAVLLSLFISFSFASQAESHNFEISKNLDIYNSIFRELDLFYVDSIKPEQLIRSSIDKMLAGIDPYTTYTPEAEKEDLHYMFTGEYAGVGAMIAQRDNRIFISEPYENMPAQKSGLKAGDILIEVNGEKLKGKDVSAVSNMLRGQAGETVEVLIERPGEEKQIKKQIVREKIKINPVDYYEICDDNIAYIHLSGFTEKASDELKKVLVDLKTKNNIQGLVLDLRGNPGGVIDEAINICSFFLPRDQQIVSTKGKDKQWDKVYKTTVEPIDLDLPMVVLVNGSSASASEIVSGALQDLDRAVIVGNRTYGKGLVQTTRSLNYGGFLKVTTAKYYTPSGRCIQAIDYEHRNQEGKAERIPDSLTTEFKTLHGRVVRDGGGVKPDVILDEPKNLDISYRLASDYFIFDYVTDYCNKHSQIAPINQFVFTDEDYADFKTYLKSKKFTYELKSSAVLKSLKEIAKIEGYSDIAAAEFDALEKKLSPDTDKDLELFKTQIKDLLSLEIAKRYYYQKGEMKQSLKKDEGLKKAIEILKEKDKYNSYLTGKK
jgi:carboxyl-terminal processing protease